MKQHMIYSRDPSEQADVAPPELPGPRMVQACYSPMPQADRRPESLRGPVLAGMTAMPFTSFVRMRWSVLLAGTDQLGTALAFESICDEAVFMLGPVLVTTLAAVRVTAGLWAAILFVTVGTLFFVRARSTEPPRRMVLLPAV